MEWFFWLSLLVSTFLLLRGIITSTTSSSSKGRQPPGPTPLPIVGNLLAVGVKPHRSLAALAKEHGPVMALKLGSVTTVVISSPEAAKEALLLNDKAFSRALFDAVRIPYYESRSLIFRTTADQRWKGLRRLCTNQLFTPNRLDVGQGLRRQKVQEMVSYVRGLEGRVPVDVGRSAFATTINLISNTVCSNDLVDIAAKSAQEFWDLVRNSVEQVGKPNVSDFFPLLRALDLQGIRRRVTVTTDKMMMLFDEMIDSRLKAMAQGSTPPDFLDVLLRLEDQNDSDFKLDRILIRVLLMDLFFAGSDTTAITTEWVMAELLRHPDVMAKARAEIAEVIGGPGSREVEESDIPRLLYLQAVVKENLRLHPSLPLLLPREAESDVELCGYGVRKGTRVLVNMWAIGRDENVWADAESFVPERFLGSPVDFRGRYFELIPFGSGRRICPGLPLAFRMVHLMVASLLHSFEWRLPDGMEPSDLDLTEKLGVSIALATPLRAVAVPY